MRGLKRAFLALAVTAAATLSVTAAAAGPAAALNTAVPDKAAPDKAALGNGLALTPPMGWNDWNSFGCNVNATLVQQTADKFVSSGMPSPRWS